MQLALQIGCKRHARFGAHYIAAIERCRRTEFTSSVALPFTNRGHCRVCLQTLVLNRMQLSNLCGLRRLGRHQITHNTHRILLKILYLNFQPYTIIQIEKKNKTCLFITCKVFYILYRALLRKENILYSILQYNIQSKNDHTNPSLFVLEKRHFCSNSFHLFDRIVLMLHDLNHWLFFFLLFYELFNIMNYRENSYILINYCIVSKFS